MLEITGYICTKDIDKLSMKKDEWVKVHAESSKEHPFLIKFDPRDKALLISGTIIEPGEISLRRRHENESDVGS